MSEKQMKSEVQSIPSAASLLQNEAKQHLQTLQQDENVVSRAYELFAYHDKVWPDQCKHVAGLVQKIQEPVQRLFTLLERPELRVAPIASHRYVLLMTLQRVDEQITELPPLIIRFRATCQAKTKQTIRQKEEIQSRLKTLHQAYNKTLQDVSDLSDMLYFQVHSSTQVLQAMYSSEDEREQQ